MKRYILKYEDLVINTMITINQKENRRVIDSIDIHNYRNIIVNKFCKEKNMKIIFNENYDSFMNETMDYILIKDNKFIMLPWIESRDLINAFRGYLPLDLSVMLCNTKIPNMLDDRSKVEKEKFKRIENMMEEFYSNQIENENLELERKKQKNIVKLSKIKNIREQNEK